VLQDIKPECIEDSNEEIIRLTCISTTAVMIVLF